jgi:penicillin-binding protein 2
MAIGQGELGITPLQLANYCSAIANRGYFFTPHLVKNIENGSIAPHFQEKKLAGIDQMHFDPVIKGMEIGIGSGAFYAVPGIPICGKTGTAENPHGSDHSVFMAFAPKDNPQIAVSVYIENGVWGARYAAPIASLIIEQYLTDSISGNRAWLEKQMIEANLLNPFQPK